MKIIISILVTSFIVLNLFAGPFSDVPKEHWSYKAVRGLVSQGIVKGYSENTFQEEKNVTRYKIAMIVGSLLGEEKDGKAIEPRNHVIIEKLKVEFKDELELLGVKIKAHEDEAKASRRDLSVIKSEISEVKRARENSYMKVFFGGNYTVKLNKHLDGNTPYFLTNTKFGVIASTNRKRKHKNFINRVLKLKDPPNNHRKFEDIILRDDFNILYHRIADRQEFLDGVKVK